jgi:hypothetical protein
LNGERKININTCRLALSFLLVVAPATHALILHVGTHTLDEAQLIRVEAGRVTVYYKGGVGTFDLLDFPDKEQALILKHFNITTEQMSAARQQYLERKGEMASYQVDTVRGQRESIAVSAATDEREIASMPKTKTTAKTIFTLGGIQCFKETDGKAIVVARLDTEDAAMYVQPGIKVAVLRFDADVSAAPTDLAPVENSFNISIGGATKTDWRFTADGGKARGAAISFSAYSAFNHKGTQGALAITFSKLPPGNPQLGCMCYNSYFKPTSNILLFSEKDFREGDGNEAFRAILKEIGAIE